MTHISYCIAAYRPAYCRLLVEDLLRKSTVPFEILLWLNTDDPDFEAFLRLKEHEGHPVRIRGKSPENIGMNCFRPLMEGAQCELITQIDDDVVRVSPRIAEKAADIMARHPTVKQLAADCWNDDYTWGNRPPMKEYKEISNEDGLYEGGIDGWFSVVHRDALLPLLPKIPFSKFFSLGGFVSTLLSQQGLHGYLCTKFKVFHVVGAPYVSYYGMLDFEINKYRGLHGPEGGAGLAQAREKGHIPPHEILKRKVEGIYKSIDSME